MSSKPGEPIEPWRSAITRCDDESIWYQGLDVNGLMQSATFAETVFLLHKGRLPTPGERRTGRSCRAAGPPGSAAHPTPTAA